MCRCLIYRCCVAGRWQEGWARQSSVKDKGQLWSAMMLMVEVQLASWKVSQSESVSKTSTLDGNKKCWNTWDSNVINNMCVCIYMYIYINTCTSNIAYIHIDIHDIDVVYYTPTSWVMGLQLEYRLVHGRSAPKSSRNTTLIQRGLVDCDQGVFLNLERYTYVVSLSLYVYI